MTRVFIDGSAGTTGLRIRERLLPRADLDLVVLPESIRKDPDARRRALTEADVAILCLPDAAAVESVGMVENPQTVIIDTSTAHRTADGWEYGFPELAGRRERIARSKRIANPGCHASGFVALVEPLVRAGVLRSDVSLCAFSLTGYSGGGKRMIAEYESKRTEGLLFGGRQYALGQMHKHLPEMVKVCGLNRPPCFSPIVVPHFSGMEVTVQVFAEQFSEIPRGGLVSAVGDVYRSCYAACELVRFVADPEAAEGGFLSSAAMSGSDAMAVSVFGNDERVLLVSRFDNLGKGASGAAIQNLNLVIGKDETEGLVADFGG